MSQEHFDFKDIATVLFVGFTALSLLWSPDPSAGLYEVVKIASLALVFLALRRVDLSEIGTPIVASVVVVLLYAWFVNVLPHGGFRNENFVTDYLLVALPLMFVGSSIVAFPLAAIVVGYLLIGNGSNLEFVVLAGMALFCLVWWAKTPTKAGIAGLSIIAGVSVIFLAATAHLGVTWSILDRVHLSLGTLGMWAEHPIIGNGAGSFAHLWPMFQDTDVRLIPGLGYLGAQGSYTYISAAHNDFLQIMASYGLIGFGLFSIAVLWGVRGSTYAVIALGALGILSLGEFALQNAGVAVLGAIALALISPARPSFQVRLRPLIGAGMVVFGAFAISTGARAGQANHAFAFTSAYIASRPTEAFIANLNAERMFPGDTRIRLQLFRSFVAAFQAGGIHAELGVVDQLYDISRSAIPDDRSLLIARLVFLVSAGLCEDECDEIVARMSAIDSRYNGIGRIRDMVAAAKALE